MQTRIVNSPPKETEDLGIFDFEGEEFGVANSKEEDTKQEDSAIETEEEVEDDYTPPAPPNPTPKEVRPFLCGSLPVKVPKLASTWQPNSNWSYSDSEGDEHGEFEKPHEMAARTYKEITLETGGV